MRGTRHLVLDSTAASAIVDQRSRSRTRALVAAKIAMANGTVVVPTAVRVESGWVRTDPRAAAANRLVKVDDDLDRAGADLAGRLRLAVPTASVADASVAVAAARCGPGLVEVLTSDLPDITALCDQLDVQVLVTQV